MMIRGLLKGMAGLKDLFLLKMISQDLQSYGEPLAAETTG